MPNTFETFIISSTEVYIRLLVLLYTMLPRVIVWGQKKNKIKLEMLLDSRMSHNVSFTYIDNRVFIQQFRHRLHSLQADRQLVAITLNHRLTEQRSV